MHVVLKARECTAHTVNPKNLGLCLNQSCFIYCFFEKVLFCREIEGGLCLCVGGRRLDLALSFAITIVLKSLLKYANSCPC